MDGPDLDRRVYLAGLAATAGMAGCSGLFSDGDESQTATPDRGDSDTAGGGSRTPFATPSGRRQHRPTAGDQVLASRDGHVVVVGRGLDGHVAIDPTETDTPVGDAFRLLDEAGGARGFGTVLLPPTTVVERAPLRPSQHARLLGWGINTTTLAFADTTRDGIRVETLRDGKFVTLDGFTLSGSASGDARESGSAIHFDNDTANPKHFDIGSLAFREWVDPVLDLENGAPFGSVWYHLDFGFGQNDGRELAIGRNEGFLGSRVLYVSAGNRTGDPVITTDYSGARFDVGFLNVGGSAGPALELRTTWNGHVSVGGINYEPGTERSGSAVFLDGPAGVRIEHVRNTDATLDSVIRFDRKNANNVIGRVDNAGTLRRGKIEITAQPAGSSFYFGSSSEFVTEFDSLAEPIWAFGDMASADGRRVAEAPAQPRTYGDPDPSDLTIGEVGIAESDGGAPSLVYRDREGSLHHWRAE
ncbi:hypothetical protein [Haloarcula litorea]|uniref:hypothetical protein n=1 Tax=Haloarcula litorea TaxID=3032579 RepID=UPI0023E7F54A|nr:hypothetical protein [Halomicroarcula sp. GDY20]